MEPEGGSQQARRPGLYHKLSLLVKCLQWQQQLTAWASEQQEQLPSAAFQRHQQLAA